MRKWVLVTASCLAAGAMPLSAAAAKGISAADRQLGATRHAGMLREYGAPLSGAAADFVARVGRRVAVQSGLSSNGDDFTVTLLDSTEANAFATTGGYIYVTRGMLALVRDEAELASVLGHEVAHVAKHHVRAGSQRRTVSNVLIGAIFMTMGQPAANAAGRGAFLLNQGFSRSDEFEADDLGAGYMAAAGYDPSANIGMLAVLDRNRRVRERLLGSSKINQAESTHPETRARIDRAQEKVRRLGRADGRERNRDAYLAAVDGLPYGMDPAYGFHENGEFKLPVQRIALTLPLSHAILTSEGKVTLVGQGTEATFSDEWLDTVGNGGVEEIFDRMGGMRHMAVQSGSVGDFDIRYALARPEMEEKPVDIAVVVYTQRGQRRHYSIVTATPRGSGLGPFRNMVESVRKIPPSEPIDARPLRVKIVTVQAGDTVEKLAAQMPVADRAIDQFRLLNGLDGDEPLTPGDRIKTLRR